MSKYTETVNNSKAITDNYTVKKEKISGITVYMYIPKEKKEKDMKETNLEHYKEDLKEILKINFDNPRGTIRKIREKFGCQIKVKSGEYATDAILEWMAQPYKEPILDKVEREYLKAVIRPFRNKIDTISKFQTWDDSSQYIYIGMKDRRWSNLPCFPKGTMYKGMKAGKHYTLKELGL